MPWNKLHFSLSTIKTIKRYSVDGKLVMEKIINDKATLQSLNISQLNQGIYLMSCVTDDGEKYFKVVKE